METDDLIPAELFCACHQAELSFIEDLHASGLVVIILQEGKPFLPLSGLPAVEKYVRLHYEMDINMEGIEAIASLLEKLDHLQKEVTYLQNRLSAYQTETL